MNRFNIARSLRTSYFQSIRAISAAVAQLPYTELVGGSNPSSPTSLSKKGGRSQKGLRPRLPTCMPTLTNSSPLGTKTGYGGGFGDTRLSLYQHASTKSRAPSVGHRRINRLPPVAVRFSPAIVARVHFWRPCRRAFWR